MSNDHPCAPGFQTDAFGRLFPVDLTAYPPGTPWTCPCGRVWVSIYALSYPHETYWRPARWWERKLGRYRALTSAGRRYDPRREPMPARFYELADYNSGRSRGRSYEAATVERMATLQTDFNAWSRRRLEREAAASGAELVEMESGGTLMVPHPWPRRAEQRGPIRPA